MLKPLEPMEEIRMSMLRPLYFRACGAYVDGFCMSGEVGGFHKGRE